MFKLGRYQFTPSYEFKYKSLLLSLTNEFQPLFVSYIAGDLCKSLEPQLYNGIQGVLQYILKGLEYRIKEDFQSKTAIERKLGALMRVLSFYSDDYMESLNDDFVQLAEDTIYEALGMVGSSAFKELSPSSNFILYCKDRLFYKFLAFIEEKVGEYSSFDEEFSIPYQDKFNIVERLVSGDFVQIFGEEISLKIKEGLMSEKIDEELYPYVELLVTDQRFNKELKET